MAVVRQQFDEIHVYENVAERTGATADRSMVRGRRGICLSLTDLGAKCRRFGDGYYYLISSAWPEDATVVNLNERLRLSEFSILQQ